MTDWSTYTWPDGLEHAQGTDQADEQARLDTISYRERCDNFGELWKQHARNGFDRPPTTPPNP